MTTEKPPVLFPISWSVNMRDAGSILTPEEVPGRDYDTLRREYRPLQTSIFEGQQLKAVYKVFRLDLSVAAVDFQIPIVGNLFKFKYSTNATDLIQVRFGIVQNDQIPFLRGEGLNGMYFDNLFLSWDAIAASTATIVTMFDPRDERATA